MTGVMLMAGRVLNAHEGFLGERGGNMKPNSQRVNQGTAQNALENFGCARNEGLYNECCCWG